MFIPIPGYEGIYKINELGTILGPYNKPLKINGDNYPKVYLYKDGVRKHLSVHVLVMLAFVGPRPDGLQIRHKDGDVTNFKLDNLCYGTPKENADDRRIHGTHLEGERCYNSVLTERKVRIARGLHKLDFTVKRIAEILDVKYQTVWRCIHKSWAHMTCELV